MGLIYLHRTSFFLQISCQNASKCKTIALILLYNGTTFIFSNLNFRSKTFGLTYVKITQKGPIKKATKEVKKVHFFMIHGT